MLVCFQEEFQTQFESVLASKQKCLEKIQENNEKVEAIVDSLIAFGKDLNKETYIYRAADREDVEAPEAVLLVKDCEIQHEKPNTDPSPALSTVRLRHAMPRIEG